MTTIVALSEFKKNHTAASYIVEKWIDDLHTDSKWSTDIRDALRYTNADLKTSLYVCVK